MPKQNQKSWPWLAFIILSALFYAYFHNLYAFDDFNHLNLDLLSGAENPALEDYPELTKKERHLHKGKESSLVWLSSKEAMIPFGLSSSEALRLRIIAYYPKMAHSTSEAVITINGREAGRFKPGWKGEYEKFSFNLNSEWFRAGGNTLSLTHRGPDNYLIGYDLVNLKNFSGKSNNFPKVSVQFADNYRKRDRNPFRNPYAYAIFPAMLFLLWLIPANIIKTVSSVTIHKAFKRVFYANLVSMALLAVIFMFNRAAGYTVIIDPKSLYGVVALPSAIILLYSLFTTLCRSYSALVQKAVGGLSAALGGKDIGAVNNGKSLISIRFSVRFAGTSAILLFMALLASAGGFMILRRQDIAEGLADIAYFSLVFGVILRILDGRRQD